MINLTDYYHIVDQRRGEVGNFALENEKAVVVYFGDGRYMAVEKQVSGKEYTFSGLYHRSTRGDFKKAKKAFEKYSGIVKQ